MPNSGSELNRLGYRQDWDKAYREGARSKNIGWRIDYFLVSESWLPSVKSAFILEDITGSDHCPVGIVLKMICAESNI